MFGSSVLPDRFWDKVEPCPTSGCWHWIAADNGVGYGRFYWSPLSTKNASLAHRVSYTEIVGPIPDGKVLDHLCRNRGCCNPAHLEVVTHQTNINRGNGAARQNANKTHCKRGHEFTSENTKHQRGGRACRTCIRAASRADYARRKDA